MGKGAGTPRCLGKLLRVLLIPTAIPKKMNGTFLPCRGFYNVLLNAAHHTLECHFSLNLHSIHLKSNSYTKIKRNRKVLCRAHT